MELDIITKRKPSKGKGKVGLKKGKKGSYYTYSKPGHYARDCRSRRMP
jgi:hypothetical protein